MEVNYQPPDVLSHAVGTTDNLNALLFWAILMAALIVLFFLLRKIFHFFSVAFSHHQSVVFLIRVPKEKAKEENNSMAKYLQQLKEEIARGETIFASIGGLKVKRWSLEHWLFGREDNFAFEIVAHGGKINFYASAPKKLSLYLEQQIHAYYPEASIEIVEDYNAFNPNNKVRAAYLKPARGFIFPIKTYNEFNADPLDAIFNSLSKIESDESISLQYVVRSAEGAWHLESRNAVLEAYKKNDISKLSGGNFFSSFFSFFGSIFDEIFKKAEDKNKSPESSKQLTEKEREMLKHMEEKNSKAGLDVNIRIVVSARDEAHADTYLSNVFNAFNQYNYYEYGNGFKRYRRFWQQWEVIQDNTINNFIYRRLIDWQSFILNTEELNSLFHLPLAHNETPNIDWLMSKSAPAPANMPEEGLLLGYNLFRGQKTPIRIKQIDRRRHTYIIGKSGTGKSVLLNNMAIQDIEAGHGVCVMDPNGDLITDILERIPPERAEDVIVFSPADIERPLAFNLLEFDSKYPEQKSFVINEMINIFDKLYDLKATGGPIFEQYMRNALLLIMDDPESGSTLMEVPKVLADENFRRLKLSRCKNPTVVDFWKKEAEKAGGDAALANVVPYITSKLTQFVANDMMRPIIGQQNSSFNFRDIMDNQKILLVDLPKGAIGEMNAYLLGMIIVGKILIAALSRTDIEQKDRKDFYLYIDEFQNFTTNSICQILSEARKYALCLNIAHQYLGQLNKGQDTQIKDAVFGNVGTLVSFKVGSEDAEFLVKDFGPVFNAYDLINVGRGGFIKLLVDGATVRPFSLQTVWPLMGTFREGIGDKIRELSRYKFGQDRRLVESDIRRRSLKMAALETKE